MHRPDISGDHGIPALLLTACAPAFPDDPAAVAHIAVHALTPASTRALRLQVSGPGMGAPVALTVPVDGERTARALVSVPPGAVRRIEIAAIGSDGETTHHGGVTMPLLAGGHAPLNVLLMPV